MHEQHRSSYPGQGLARRHDGGSGRFARRLRAILRADPARRQRPADRAERAIWHAVEAGLRSRARRDPGGRRHQRPQARLQFRGQPERSAPVGGDRAEIRLRSSASSSSSATSPARPRWRPRRSISAAGLVQFGFTNSHPDFTKGGDFMWSTSVSQADEQPLLADYAVKRLGLKKLAVLHLNTDWGRTSRDYFVEAAKEHGARGRGHRRLSSRRRRDFRSTLVRVRDANPDWLDPDLLLLRRRADHAPGAPGRAQAGDLRGELGLLAEIPGARRRGRRRRAHRRHALLPRRPAPEVQKFVAGFKTKYNGWSPTPSTPTPMTR